MSNSSVVILAAGAGTRMKSQTPKVLHRVSGRAILDYPVLAALEISDDVQIVLYHEFDALKAYVDRRFGDAVVCVRQDHENYPGTAGALKAASPRYDRVVAINGDMPLISVDFIKALASRKEDAAIGVFSKLDPFGYGRVIIKDDRVLRIVEEKDANEAQKKVTTVNGGVYSFSRSFLEEFLPKINAQNAQNEYYITDLIALAAERNKEISAVWGDEHILSGVNSKSELSEAEAYHQNALKEKLMNAGVAMRLPETIYIDANATFEGECVIENGAVILGKSTIARSVIKAHSVVEDSAIIDSDIGPMAHIRPNSEIKNAHIGNFVETKKAKLNGVKAGHLSYLGDATIDEGTNIGAGTITCNYDGKDKYQTTIGKNVFIGSDTQLIAPIIIPDNVLIGAGTTVVKNPNEGDLVLSRSEQKSIAGFFFKFFGKKY
ncbi:MAG: bifunctional UDP-N-acetylglucosamine diphosphorylase/glucosamine-1-phosphate N-acetyltransferase GlmU [Helicobacteraceae bacterium]|jgi:bifunctional UDP-N-acetylglucosamine pyrophosphorylase/glucosamine-1-phosphate N-acetyltransferase|nr:bifunctional UDP-N-acetylglucosamine diphosphorylase/glucosamine-1-phosphate N-acetyltransferase GlmU [Helicobacteraceae bacterium]